MDLEFETDLSNFRGGAFPRVMRFLMNSSIAFKIITLSL